MITTRKPIDGFAAGTMLLLCAIWGAQQVAIVRDEADQVRVQTTEQARRMLATGRGVTAAPGIRSRQR